MIAKKVKKKIALFLSIFIICFSTVCIIFLKTDIFLIKDVIVKGNLIISENEILNCNKLNGINIFFVDKKAIKKNIMNNPYTENVKIEKKFPATIILDITEKEVAGYIKYNNLYITIDNNGKMIQAENNISGNKPVILGMDFNGFIPGKCIFEKNDKRLNSFMEILKINQYKEFKSNVNTVDIKNQYDIVINTKDGYDIKIGDCNDLEYKLSCAYSIMNNINVKGLKGTINVDSNGIAVFKKK